MSAFLLVRSADRRYAVPVSEVLEIVQLSRPLPAPAAHPAMRGVVSIRERLVSLVHLGALVSESMPPDQPASSAVLLESKGIRFALEVDGADDVVRGSLMPVEDRRARSWVAGLIPIGDLRVPVLDIPALAETLRSGTAERV